MFNTRTNEQMQCDKKNATSNDAGSPVGPSRQQMRGFYSTGRWNSSDSAALEMLTASHPSFSTIMSWAD